MRAVLLRVDRPPGGGAGRGGVFTFACPLRGVCVDTPRGFLAWLAMCMYTYLRAGDRVIVALLKEEDKRNRERT